MWMQSKTKMWHMVGFTGVWDGQEEIYAKCQSYNLDRPNLLKGEAVENPPESSKVCKKCSSHKK